MTKEETKQILALLQVNYPHVYKPLSKEEKLMLVESWRIAFADVPFTVMQHAVLNMMKAEGFPTLAAVQKAVDVIMSPGSDSELWGALYRAISNGTYHAKEEFEKLPHECQVFLGAPSALRDLAMTDTGTINTVVKGQFIKQIKAIKEYEAVYAGLPHEVKLAIQQSRQMLLEGE